ncbi:MAG: ferritin-like domain-containing protein [Candidatus Margulisbacteria bacterium]|nr:ferritin-like domain-containing protein [Candidatus Margulisiibacteriota bacterium]
MQDIKQELIDMLNKALELEHAARIQYLAHAETITGLNSEPLRARIKEIAGDEANHEEKFRTLIGDYLNGVPVMSLAPTKTARGIDNIIEINIEGEKSAVDFYKQIYKKVTDHKEELVYTFETLEHTIRHIIIEEEEHIVELEQLIEE